MEGREISSVYLHINNGGITFSVVDQGHGPCVKIESTHFGNKMGSIAVNVDPDALGALAKMFEEASEHKNYSETYCCAAMLRQVKSEGAAPGGSPDLNIQRYQANSKTGYENEDSDDWK